MSITYQILCDGGTFLTKVLYDIEVSMPGCPVEWCIPLLQVRQRESYAYVSYLGWGGCCLLYTSDAADE